MTMFKSSLLTFAVLLLLMAGCNTNTIYTNPTSPSADQTEWRTMNVDSTGGTLDFPDIGATVTFPANVVPMGVDTFQIRLFPSGIPLLRPVRVDQTRNIPVYRPRGLKFNPPVQVTFKLAEKRMAGSEPWAICSIQQTHGEETENVTVLSDGDHAAMTISEPGIYGNFELVPLWFSDHQHFAGPGRCRSRSRRFRSGISAVRYGLGLRRQLHSGCRDDNIA